MKKLNQRGALDMMFVVLLVVLLAFGGFVVWRVTAADNETADSAVSTQAGSESKASSSSETEDDTETDTDEAAIPEGWVTYENTDLGITLNHPETWGEPVYSRNALNNEVYETNLPHRISFSEAEIMVTIIPNEWTFNPPGASEWNSPLSLDSAESNLINEASLKTGYTYSAFGGDFIVNGFKEIEIPKADASGVEYQYSRTGNFTDDGSTQGEPCLIEETLTATEECYPDNLLDEISDSISSFEVI